MWGRCGKNFDPFHSDLGLKIACYFQGVGGPGNASAIRCPSSSNSQWLHHRHWPSIFFHRLGNICGMRFLQKKWPKSAKHDCGSFLKKTLPSIGGHHPVPSLSSFQQRVGYSNILHHPLLLKMGFTHDKEENLSMPYMTLIIWQKYGFPKFQSVLFFCKIFGSWQRKEHSFFQRGRDWIYYC